MKICEKCGESFSISLKIDGKRHNLSSRRFCLKCSPFKERNTKNLAAPTRLTKVCSTCKIEHGVENFYSRKSGGPTAECKTCFKERMASRHQDSKIALLQEFGGACKKCGYSTCLGALSFHHINAADKLFSISSRGGWNLDKLREEAAKCVVLCQNCHIELHAKLWRLDKDGAVIA